MRKLSIDDDLAVKALEGIHTKLYGPLNAPFFTYNMVPWTLHVRKELFSPSENSLVHPLALHLIFCQVVQDTYNDACLRIGHEDRIRMQNVIINLYHFFLNYQLIIFILKKDAGKLRDYANQRQWWSP